MIRKHLSAALALAVLAGVAHAQPLTTAFTYQARLDDAGVPANNTYDLQFKLFNASAGGAQQGATLTRNDVAVAQGLVTQVLDFGAQFAGQRRWIQVEVRLGTSAGAYTILPRQELTVSPNAAYAMNAGTVAQHSLDDAYNDGASIVADAGAVTISGVGGVASEGAVVSGNSIRNGVLQINGVTTGNKLAALQAFSASGGALQGYEEDGTTRVYALEPDSGGAGGFLSIFGSGSGSMFFDGVASGGGPRVSFNGGAAPSDFVFDTNNTGNASAVLPTGAISAAEMFDEPGVANAADNSVGTTLSTTASFTNVISRSITVPGPGYVIVFGTLETLHSHSAGTETNLQFGVSDNPTSQPSTQDMGVRLASALSSGQYLLTNNSHSVFPVAAAGTFTYYVLARMNSGNGQTFDTELTCLYVPTAYGTVELTGPRSSGGGGEQFGRGVPSGLNFGRTADDVSAERQQELARHLNAMAAEQQKMQAEIERLRAQVAEGNRPPARK